MWLRTDVLPPLQAPYVSLMMWYRVNYVLVAFKQETTVHIVSSLKGLNFAKWLYSKIIIFMDTSVCMEHTYRITGNLAVVLIWRIWPLIAKLPVDKRQCCSSNAWDAKLKSANYVQMAHSPNIILAKFSLYGSTSLRLKCFPLESYSTTA